MVGDGPLAPCDGGGLVLVAHTQDCKSPELQQLAVAARPGLVLPVAEARQACRHP